MKKKTTRTRDLGVPGIVFLTLNDTLRSSDSDHIIAEKVC